MGDQEMWLLMILAILPAAYPLKCFSSSTATVEEVTGSNKSCILELNLFNLGCLSPFLTLLDAETAFASWGSFTKKGANTCYLDEYYVKCECYWNECNRGWNYLKNITFTGNVASCLNQKCSNNDNCYSYGTKQAKAFNFYQPPTRNTSVSRTKKGSSRLLEYIILWLIGGTFPLLFVGLIILDIIRDSEAKRRAEEGKVSAAKNTSISGT